VEWMKDFQPINSSGINFITINEDFPFFIFSFMKLAVVASGWHFPLDFYESVARQIVVKDWQYDLFCISHRDPKYSKEEKAGLNLKELDTILYKDIATIEQIKHLVGIIRNTQTRSAIGVVQTNGWRNTISRNTICFCLPMMTISFIITSGLEISFTL
jgi:hypothetical protein